MLFSKGKAKLLQLQLLPVSSGSSTGQLQITIRTGELQNSSQPFKSPKAPWNFNSVMQLENTE